MNRRRFLDLASACGVACLAPGLARAQAGGARRNVSSFNSQTWRPYFSSVQNGAILVDIRSRVLHYWDEDMNYHLYPSSVPLSEDLTRRGRTHVTKKVEGPSWRPTPAMKERNPEWPDFIGPGDPENPMGTHALHLGWQYYRIHGTHDTRKIGRQSSNGCIGLYNEHIADLFARVRLQCQVLIV